jgi:endonuclease YncB( thermonuclease family)
MRKERRGVWKERSNGGNPWGAPYRERRLAVNSEIGSF